MNYLKEKFLKYENEEKIEKRNIFYQVSSRLYRWNCDRINNFRNNYNNNRIMTKKQTIQQSYIDQIGLESYSKINLHIDSDGWINISEHWFQHDKNKFETFKILNGEKNNQPEYLIRPKSIDGIENNNGWTEIKEQHERFPDVDVWICNLKANKAAFFHDALTRIPNKYTHFKIVERPKPPIF